MKKLLLLFTAAMLLFAGCSQFDDSRIWDAIDELEDRVDDLEDACEKMNTNIEALQTLVSALQNSDTIKSIAPIKQGDKVVGYTITFTKSEPITIYHGNDGKDGQNGQNGADGKDGKDGYTPVIGVAQDSDMVYYWTLDGEWLLDQNGNKIKANGSDGKDGQDGANGTDGANGSNGEDGADGITPQLEIRDGYWYISYDNGRSWVELGKATGEDGKDGQNGADGENGKDGDSLFESVTWDEEYAYFTLSDGTVIKISLSEGAGDEATQPANEIWYTSTDGEVVTPNATHVFGANIVSNTYEDGKGVITFDGDVTSIGDWAFFNCGSLESVTIPDSVTSIGNCAFSCSGSLASVSIGNGVTSIIQSAFERCPSLAEFNGKFASSDGRCLIIDGVLNSFAPAGLTEYTIPESVTEIGYYAFYYCGSLASVIIPDSVTSIGEGAFFNCGSLASVTIPDSVTSIGERAFRSCYSLASVTIGSGVTSIGVFAFQGCSNLASVTIEEGVTSIGYCAFRDCFRLASVTIPDSVTSIGNEAFCYCTSLASVSIGNGVTLIGEWAFAYCSSLASVYCKATTPPSLGGSVFYDNASELKIYVPTESVDAYKAADAWSNYANAIVGYDFENGGGGNTEMVEVEAVYMIGAWGKVEGGVYVTLFYVSDKPWQSGEMPENDSRTYSFMVGSNTAPVDDEIPHGTYIFEETFDFDAETPYVYVDANGEAQELMYTDGVVVVSEGKIEATLTLENGEVHHVVYEGSLTTLGEVEIGA